MIFSRFVSTRVLHKITSRELQEAVAVDSILRFEIDGVFLFSQLLPENNRCYNTRVKLEIVSTFK